MKINLDKSPDVLTIPEVAKLLNISEQTVYDYCNREENNLPVVKLSPGNFRVLKKELISWINRQQTKAKIICTACGEEITEYDNDASLRDAFVSGKCQECINKDYSAEPRP